MLEGLEARRIAVNGLDYRVYLGGEGPTILCLHGFPDSAKVWRKLAPLLIQSGYRVIAPDLRGFGETEAPQGRADYKLARVAEDCIALLDALELREPVNLIGHDWGAALGWVMAIEHPDRFRKYVTLSVGHIRAFAYAGPAQLWASSYMVLFQLGRFAEWVFSRKDFRWARAWIDYPEEAPLQLADMARPGRLRAGFNWYRANLIDAFTQDWGRCRIPVLGVWSDGDVYLLEKHIRDDTPAYMDAEYRYAKIQGANHWMQLQRPVELSSLVVEFFGAEG